MASRYNTDVSDIQKRTNELESMRHQGQTSNPVMIAHLVHLEQALKQKRIASGEDKLRAIYALAVHNPNNEKYARQLGRYMYAARDYHEQIAEAVALGRKATKDVGFDPDSETEPKSPLQRVVTGKLDTFLEQGYMRPKKVRQLFGLIKTTSEKLDAPSTDTLLTRLGQKHAERQKQRNFAGKIEDFIAYGLDVMGIHVDGLRPEGVKNARQVQQKMRQNISQKNISVPQ